MKDADSRELEMNADDLYREDTFTDRGPGTIRQLTPVKVDGSEDPGRARIYVGQAQLLTPLGAVPLSFEIKAASLSEAIDGFAAQAKIAMEETISEMQELRRQAASSIVVPEAGGGLGVPGGPGKIKLP